MLWPRMPAPWQTVLAVLVMVGFVCGVLGFAYLGLNYGMAWLTPATPENQERLSAMARLVAPPGTRVSLKGWYSKGEPHAEVRAEYAYEHDVPEEEARGSFSTTFRMHGWTLCRSADYGFLAGVIMVYRNGYTLAKLTTAATGVARQYVIEFSWRVPPDHC